jgi:hypothetical protein
MLAPNQELAVATLMGVWLIFIGVYVSADVTCEDRRSLSLAFAILLSPFSALSLYFYISAPCMLTGTAFGMLMSLLIYMIARWLLPCREERIYKTMPWDDYE